MGKIFDMPAAKVGRARNAPLESGVYKYSRSKMYHKKAIYKFTKKTTPKAAAEKKPAFIEKKVGGAKNGGTRKVATNKPKSDYPTYSKDVVKTSKNLFSKQKHSLRPSLSAGVIAIVLAGVHKGKKVVVLKQLGTGLLLVSGPYALNGCPPPAGEPALPVGHQDQGRRLRSRHPRTRQRRLFQEGRSRQEGSCRRWKEGRRHFRGQEGVLQAQRAEKGRPTNRGQE